MTDQQILASYEMVNRTKSIEELAEIILFIGTMNNGKIKGSRKEHDATKMSNNCKELMQDYDLFNRMQFCKSLTRQFGIRQQAIMLCYHEKLVRK